MAKFGKNEPIPEAIAHIEAINRLSNDDLKSAYLCLLLAAERAGLTTLAEKTAISAVQFRSVHDAYLYAFIVNQNDLLFYIRGPALQIDNSMESDVRSKFPDLQRNAIGELQIRITNSECAIALAEWLFDR